MSAVSEAIYHLRKTGGTETIFCPVGTVIQEGYQVLEPILQIWQGNTMQDLLCHLTEAEKQKIYLLDQSYRQTEQKIFLQAYNHYAG